MTEQAFHHIVRRMVGELASARDGLPEERLAFWHTALRKHPERGLLAPELVVAAARMLAAKYEVPARQLCGLAVAATHGGSHE